MRTLLIAALLTACATGGDPEAKRTYFPDRPSPALTTEPFLTTFSETTPLVWKGRPVLVSFMRDAGYSIWVRELDGTAVAAHPWTHSLGCAFVDGDRMYAFGSGPSDDRTEIVMTSSADLQNWTPNVVVLRPGERDWKLWNCSVTRGPSSFYMAYEVSGPNINGFTFRVAESTDLANWKVVGRRFSSHYAACPTIKYLEGWYYVLHLEDAGGGWRTRAVRTRDFESYEVSGAVVLSAPPGEGNNASDVDLVEYGGETILVYINGDQHTWGHTRLARYQGTMSQFFRGLWP